MIVQKVEVGTVIKRKEYHPKAEISTIKFYVVIGINPENIEFRELGFDDKFSASYDYLIDTEFKVHTKVDNKFKIGEWIKFRGKFYEVVDLVHKASSYILDGRLKTKHQITRPCGHVDKYGVLAEIAMLLYEETKTSVRGGHILLAIDQYGQFKKIITQPGTARLKVNV